MYRIHRYRNATNEYSPISDIGLTLLLSKFIYISSLVSDDSCIARDA